MAAHDGPLRMERVVIPAQAGNQSNSKCRTQNAE